MSDSATSPRATPFPAVPKHRLEALSDGIYAIALTLLVLELKIPELAEGASDAALGEALVALVPKALFWLLSFWVIALFWLAQQRLYRLCAVIDGVLLRTELAQLSLISLFPFSNALLGDHGGRRIAAVAYAAHLLLIALLSARRTWHFVGHPEIHGPEMTAEAARSLRTRSRVLVLAALAATGLGFVVPGWNMLAMLPTAFLSRFGGGQTSRRA